MKSFKLTSANFLLIFGIIVVFPFLIISLFNYPSADDFAFASAITKGFWKTQVDFYLNLNGRYLATFLISILISHDFIFYKFVPIIIIFCFFFSLRYLVKSVFSTLTNRNQLILSISLLAIYIFQMPSICQALYWLPASMTYQVAIILSILLLAYLVRWIATQKMKFFIISVFLSLGIMGLNETTMIIINFVLLTIFCLNFFLNKKVNFVLLLIFILAVLFSLILIKSPSNNVRTLSEARIHQHDFIFSVLQSCLEVKSMLINGLPILTVFAFLIFDFFKHDLSESDSNSIFRVHPLIVVWIWILILFLGFFPAYWAMAHCPPPRAMNVIYFFFMLGFFYLLCTVHFYFKRRNIEFLSISTYVRYFLFLLILIQFYKVNNVRFAYGDLMLGIAHRYDVQLKNRYESIKNSKQDTCYVQAIENVPVTIYLDDITSDAKCWTNRSFSDYMGKKAIILVKKK